MLVEVFVDVRIVAVREAHGIFKSRVRLDDVFEELARGRLTAFGAPIVGNQDIPIRTPDTLHEDRVTRHGDVAGGGTGDSGETGEGLMPIVVGVFGG